MDSVASDSDIDSPGPEGKALSRIKTRTGLGGHMAYGDKSKHEVQDYTDALAENVSAETPSVGGYLLLVLVTKSRCANLRFCCTRKRTRTVPL
jgi:hypothetical protein